MSPFDPNKPFRLRDGAAASLIAIIPSNETAFGPSEDGRLIVAMDDRTMGTSNRFRRVTPYRMDGRRCGCGPMASERQDDLVNVPRKHEGVVQVFVDSHDNLYAFVRRRDELACPPPATCRQVGSIPFSFEDSE